MYAIKKKIIKKYLDFLNDVKKNEEENFPFSMRELIKSHGINTHIPSIMKNLNLIENTGGSTYKTKFLTEPITARSIIANYRETVREYQRNRRKSEINISAQNDNNKSVMPKNDSNKHEQYIAYRNLVKVLFPGLPEAEITNFSKVISLAQKMKESAEKYESLPGNLITFHLKPTLKNGVVAIDINFLEGTTKELRIEDLTL